jgi:hypothetical protein
MVVKLPNGTLTNVYIADYNLNLFRQIDTMKEFFNLNDFAKKFQNINIIPIRVAYVV